jgi:hypothetical protein
VPFSPGLDFSQVATALSAAFWCGVNVVIFFKGSMSAASIAEKAAVADNFIKLGCIRSRVPNSAVVNRRPFWSFSHII